ncbi:MAG: hypothetical protein UW75_C0035G0008 [Parcubacteria group bacterium GW2011_GWF2_44_8]|nr:MAG: hypothetical protein UW75_C0035G0008 [Parcubacteria group bacterium GW2011_GWF2_44_8]
MSFARVYPLYITKAEKKGRTKAEVDKIIRWQTGYSQKELNAQIKKSVDFETFFAKAPLLNPSRKLITGVVCGVRVEEIQDKLMQEIRYLDKLIDELAKGRPKCESIWAGLLCSRQEVRSRITKYICSSPTPNLLSVLDPSSLA